MRRKIIRALLGISAIILLTGQAADDPASEATAERAKPTIAEQLAIISAVTPSLVTVEYTLQYDKGEEPKGITRKYVCPNCGRVHVESMGDDLVRENRPFEQPGFLISATSVVTSDAEIQSRFIKKIQVRHGDRVVSAVVAERAVYHNAAFLKLKRPLRGASPLKFQGKAEKPFYAVSYIQGDARWNVAVKPFSAAITVTPGDRVFSAARPNRLIVDRAGRPVALTMTSQLPPDDSWKGSPTRWPTLSAQRFRQKMQKIEKASQRSLLRVKIDLRSPRKKAGGRFGRVYSSDGNASDTEVNAIGIRVSKKRLLVLANLPAAVTARLEGIRVFDADGRASSATFEATLSDHGAFTAIIDKPLGTVIKLTTSDTLDMNDRLLLAGEIKLAGEKRIARFYNARIASHRLGHRRDVYPRLGGSEKNVFLFTMKDELLALPLAHREKISGNRYRSYSDSSRLTPSAQIAKVLADLNNNIDKANIPRSEEEENRLAWMGVVLQRLDRELARANKAVEQTQDGKTGGLIALVYPSSPAARAGIKPGMILLRLIVPDEPRPVAIRADRDSSYRAFPWERLDELPEELYDKIPPPWPSAQNSLNRTLTDIGFGEKYTAEFLKEGKLIKKTLTTIESPPFHGAAPKYEHEPLGLTVQDLTYEVRHYFKKSKNDPGVVVSGIEPGSKASIAGIKPFEVITHLNRKPVKNVEQFKQYLKGIKELQLSISRMTRSRQINVKLKKE